ncbi:hypothetical protein CF70_002715 [Cupriavidus sp. SK-3]|uniref:hypothetical protein n=1 Tax=Cupriavidus sp. SK-3 TaxID=1470558 RepID=UPI00044985F3|nr:hypothetical protein [Cupriavidus sp. SK-3]KDP87250.1 hypothetical protein CF70_002715 [Cupriavidus sp. SK-3]
MKHSHSPLSRLLALVLLATVLFARLAIAGYACPAESGAMVDSASMAATTARCLEMDEAQPALCADHQQDGRHWADSNGHSPDLSALAAAGELVHVLPLAPYTVRTFPTADSANTSPAPIYLATARLRI